MAVPAIVYLMVAGATPGLARGWAIPAATDIAFAVGVLALVGRNRVPASLRLFLTSVAIVDDMGAVAIIALFYTATLNLWALAAAAAIWAAMLWLGRRGVGMLWPYLLLAAGLWVAVLLSGIHATIAGVLAAFAIPLRPSPAAPEDATSPLHRLEHALAPWVAFMIVPLFGFANAGLSFAGMGPAVWMSPLVPAVALGLFAGKQVGVLATVRLAVSLGWAERPGRSWAQLYGVALLCGVGFTMSLFIGGLAFADATHMDAVKLGVLAGSIASALAGYGVLRLTARP
jgi:NhaA family Na+:H+ antiporter